MPAMCKKQTSFDREDAGWYAPNSSRADDNVPTWRLPGGGVTNLTDLETSFDQCIENTKDRIRQAEQHLSRLLEARTEI